MTKTDTTLNIYLPTHTGRRWHEVSLMWRVSEHVHLDQVYTPVTVGRTGIDITTNPHEASAIRVVRPRATVSLDGTPLDDIFRWALSADRGTTELRSLRSRRHNWEINCSSRKYDILIPERSQGAKKSLTWLA